MPAINEYVVKVASRCNINCSYCYEYNLGDTTWKSQPKLMSLETAGALASRIAEHARDHCVSKVIVTFHGGEPLMVGAARLDAICEVLERNTSSATQIQLGLQTNAILMSPEFIDVIKRRRIEVSVSVDGDQSAHDRHRVDHRGRGTYAGTARGIRLLQKSAPEFLVGLLAVIDVKNNPVAAFDAVAEWGIGWVDFLLPHCHWDRPPPRPGGDPLAYGRWYWDLYRAWTADRHPEITIRFLENIVGQLAGGGSIYEAMTLEPVTLAVIATDGSIEGVDSLKSTASGVQSLGLNVHQNRIDDALALDMVRVRQTGVHQLCAECQKCEFKRECAGGYFPHRWGRGRGFQNPSIYCDDLFWLLTRIRSDLLSRKATHEALFNRSPTGPVGCDKPSLS